MTQPQELKQFSGQFSTTIQCGYESLPLNTSTTLPCVIHGECTLFNQDTKTTATEEELLTSQHFKPLTKNVYVIDTSTSMKGRPLALLKIALKKVANYVTTQDIFGVVSFSTNVQEVYPLTVLDSSQSKKDFIAKIDDIVAHESTNLCGGLEQGLKTLWDAKYPSTNDNERRNLILLTDGHANVGIINSGHIISKLKTLPHAHQTNIYVMGLGYDVDEDLLQSLAVNYHGQLYAIQTHDHIQEAFGDCLGNMMASIITNCKIHVSSLYPLEELSGLLHERISPTEICYTIGTLFAEESKDVLFSLTVPSMSQSETKTLANVKVTYHDLYTNQDLTNQSLITLNIQGPTLGPENKTVRSHLTRVKVATLIESLSTTTFQSRDLIFTSLEHVKQDIEREGWDGTPLGTQLIKDIETVLNTKHLYAGYGMLYRQVSHGLKIQRQSSCPVQPVGSLQPLGGSVHHSLGNEMDHNMFLPTMPMLQRQTNQSLVDTRGYILPCTFSSLIDRDDTDDTEGPPPLSSPTRPLSSVPPLYTTFLQRSVSQSFL